MRIPTLLGLTPEQWGKIAQEATVEDLQQLDLFELKHKYFAQRNHTLDVKADLMCSKIVEFMKGIPPCESKA